MENLAHSLCGLAIARTGLDRRGPLVTPLLVVAANFPDIDHLWCFGQLRYLEHHRGVTHSFVGIAVESVLLALVTRALTRRWKLEPTRFTVLLVAAALGLLSHLGLDALNNYGVRPWWPFSDARSFGDLAFIVDPWLWLGFGAGAFLGGERRGIGRVWPFVGGVSLALTLAACSKTGPSLWLPALYGLGLLSVLVLDPWATRIGRARLARMSLLLVGGYLALLAGSTAAIETQGRDRVAAEFPSEPIVRSSVNPAPGVPGSGLAIVETEAWIRFVAVDLRAGTVRLLDGDTVTGRTDRLHPVAKRLDDPALASLDRSSCTLEIEAWHVFARHPFVARTDHATLILGDARYDCEPHASWCNLEVPLPASR